MDYFNKPLIKSSFAQKMALNNESVEIILTKDEHRKDSQRSLITLERKLRREQQKVEKANDKINKLIAEIRKPKGEKVTLINAQTLTNYKRSQLGKPEPSNRQIKRTPQNVTLADFIVPKIDNKKLVKHSQKTIAIAPKRGKIREFSIKKHKTKLKKAIVAIRERRKIELELQNKTESIPDKPNSEPENSLPIKALVEQPVIKHSRKLRPYCDHLLDPELAQLTEQILKDLFRFQCRAFQANQTKARAHKRYVVGFKEVFRQLEVNKLKLVLVAPDCEPNAGDGGLEETVERLKGYCLKKAVPYAFSLARRQMAYCLHKKPAISCVGILDYSGIEDCFARFVEALNTHKSLYQLGKLEINKSS